MREINESKSGASQINIPKMSATLKHFPAFVPAGPLQHFIGRGRPRNSLCTTLPSAWRAPSRPSTRPAVRAMVSTYPKEKQPARNPIGPDSTVLVVGASRGLGLEFTQQIAARGARVVATSRGPPTGSLAELVSAREGVSALALDVGDEESINAAAAAAGRQGLAFTHVIHSAGVARWERLGALRAQDMLEVYRVNAVGPALVAQAFRPLMKRGAGGKVPVLAVLSSKVGSIVDNGSGGTYAYRASKIAVNMICKSLSIDLQGEVSVVLLHPGYVRTDMTSGAGFIDTSESVAGMLKGVEATDEDVEFRWVDYKAEIIPW